MHIYIHTCMYFCIQCSDHKYNQVHTHTHSIKSNKQQHQQARDDQKVLINHIYPVENDKSKGSI